MDAVNNMQEAYFNIFKAHVAIAAGHYLIAEEYLIQAKGLYSLEIIEEILENIGLDIHKEIVDDVLNCQNYYTLFGLSQDASVNDIKAAYKKLQIRVHPDKNHTENANVASQIINKAYEILMDPELRQKYDKEEFHSQVNTETRKVPGGFMEVIESISIASALVAGVLGVAYIVKKIIGGNRNNNETTTNNTIIHF